MFADAGSGALFIDLQKKPLGAGRIKTTSPAVMYKGGNIQLVAQSKACKPMISDLQKIRSVASPHTLQPLAYYTQEDNAKMTYVLVTPLYNQGSLLDILLKKKLSFTFKEKVEIALHLLRCLEEIHNKGYAHRDVKCGNTLIDIQPSHPRKVSCTLCDFAGTVPIASAHGLHSQTNPAVRSPEGFFLERLQKQDYLQCDIFAAGCVLWSLYYEDPFTPWAKLRLHKGRRSYAREAKQAQFIQALQQERNSFFAKLPLQTQPILPKNRFLSIVFTMVDPVPWRRGTAHSLYQQLLNLKNSISDR
jgi:serine/threonine protein kinase